MRLRTLRTILIFTFALNVSLAFAQEKTLQENELINFSAKVKKGEVILSWKISNPKNLYKFAIESKKSSEAQFSRIDNLLFTDYIKKDNKSDAAVYSFSFKDTKTENGVYFYRLTLADAKEVTLSSQELKLGISDIADFKLHQNSPNPFNPSTLISYELKSPSEVKLSVYTLTGKLIDVLVNGNQSAGNYTVEFDSQTYPDLSTGIYFYKLETQYSTDIKKMILAK